MKRPGTSSTSPPSSATNGARARGLLQSHKGCRRRLHVGAGKGTSALRHPRHTAFAPPLHRHGQIAKPQPRGQGGTGRQHVPIARNGHGGRRGRCDHAAGKSSAPRIRGPAGVWCGRRTAESEAWERKKQVHTRSGMHPVFSFLFPPPVWLGAALPVPRIWFAAASAAVAAPMAVSRAFSPCGAAAPRPALAAAACGATSARRSHPRACPP